MSAPKLPKAVSLMVEKNNLVMAIKTLAEEEGISMDEAKSRIDQYEAALKDKQQQKLEKIANKQGLATPSIATPSLTTPTPNQTQNQNQTEPSQPFNSGIDTHPADNSTTHHNASFNRLHSGLDQRLDDMGYQKPWLPYWVKRVAIIIAVMAIVFWILWRVFGKG